MKIGKKNITNYMDNKIFRNFVIVFFIVFIGLSLYKCNIFRELQSFREDCYLSTWTVDTTGITNKAKEAILISESINKPNTDFTYCINLPVSERKDYTGTPGKYPQTCMNTVSSFYNPKRNWAQCQYFVNNCTKLGFKETDLPKPGDIIVFFKKNHAFHTGLYLGNSKYGPVINHSDGGKLPNNYHKHVLVNNLYKNCGSYVYYRYYTYVK